MHERLPDPPSEDELPPAFKEALFFRKLDPDEPIEEKQPPLNVSADDPNETQE